MFLKRIEIKGFKSFADKVELELEQGITGVVGPNGSGKSNISDAVRWVLGEQSAKILRGLKMEDVIFAGTASRKPLGFAEVSITLDNSDNTMPVEFSEVTVTRRMYRSGESEYYINKASCRLKDITELFMDTGIGKDGYSIIGQGKVEEIINAKAEDRREIFEEAAGIVKYKTRKQESEKKLENTELNITRIEDIINELDSQLEPLKGQSAKARQYLDLRERLKTLDLNLFIRNVEKIKDKVSAISECSQNLENELLENNRENSRIEEDYTEYKNKLQDADKMVESVQGELYASNNEIERYQGEVRVLNEKKLNILKNIERLEEDAEKDKDSINKFNEYLAELNETLKSFDTLLGEQFVLLDNKNSEFYDVNNKISEKDKSIEDMKSEVIELLNMISDKKSSINSFSTFKNGIERRINQINTEMQDSNNKNVELENALIEAKSQISQQTLRLDELNNKIHELEQYKREAVEESKSIDSNIFDLNGKIQSKQGRYKLLHEMESEFEGYNRSVKEILKVKNSNTMFSGVCGVVADLIHVPRQYEVAIEVALGGALQNIVTEDEYTAKHCIEFLKTNKFGRATFLPLTTIKGRDKGISEKLVVNTKGFVGFADSLISFDSKYNNIISSLLGRVIVTDNIDNAISFAKKIDYSLKIVTLDGDIINPGGAFTGGSISGKTGKILSRKREIEELEKDLKGLKDSLAVMISSKKKSEIKLKEIENRLDSSTEEKHSAEIMLSSLESRCTNITADIDRIMSGMRNLENELFQLEKEYNETVKGIEKASLELSELESRSSEISSKVQNEQSNIKDILNLKESLVNDITAIKVKIAEYRQSKVSYESKIQEVKRNIEECNIKLKEKMDEKGELTGQYKKINIDIQSTESYIKSLNEKCSTLRKKLDDLNTEREKDAIILDEMEIKKKEFSETSVSLQGEIHKLEMQKARLDMELENLQNRIWEDYEISYAAACKYKIDMDNLSQASKDINDIKEKIRELGPVNVGAIEEYKKVKERYEFLIAQKRDLEEAKDSLNKVISEMTDKMKVQFIKNFEIINNNFTLYFQKLFGGGRAELVLCDAADVLSSGIEIIAQPPGKKLQSLTLLSGGEKALTAIALLFAILKMKPSPFCILDEIEAALDDVNVARFSSFLRELSKKTQFIVVTQRKGTMEASDALYGVTMEEKGISRLVSAKLTEKVS